MTGDDATAVEVFELLAADHTLDILAATATEPMSVKQLAAECDASTPTVYRRVEAMEGHRLLREETRIDRDGNHYAVYRSNVSGAAVRVDPDEGEVTVDLTYRESVDRFRDLWEGLQE